jgi:putative nucleotidyltransferase with HDIG domain
VSEQNEERGHRWSARSRTGFLVSVASFAIPIALSVVSALTASTLLPRATSSAWQVAWWIGVLLIAWIGAVVGERIARPLLPLASLLKMSLLFPDRAPSRFAVAWRSGSTRQLDRYVHGLDTELHREPVTTAAEILTLVTALSSHDRRTRGHSERVRAYTDLIADQLRLPQADRDRLRWSALLHDVGKLIVHVDILNKAGKPSEAEWEIIRRHPQEGQRMIEPLMEWLGEWGHAVEQHHENFDGTGYPFGLSGEQISFGARIVSVADAFEVMTAARSYKSPISPAAARKELTRCAGTQFDPTIVRAFLDISVGRQRWVIGPLAWLFDVPIISQFGNLGNVLAVGSQVALIAGSVTLGAVAAGAQLSVHPPTPPDRPAAVTAALVKRQPEVVTVLSQYSKGPAGRVRDDATIANATPDAGGTVTYFVFNNDACASKGIIATLGPVNVKRGEVPNSPLWRPTGPAGTYYFVAAYSGDANDDAARSGCNSSPIAVGPGVEVITVQPSSTTIAVGGEVHASAVIAASRSGAGGSVTYDVYNNDSCSGGGLVTTLGPVTVTSGTVPNSPNWMATGVTGTYYFVAVYSGDANHKSAVSKCNGASVIVSTSPPDVITTLPNKPGTPSPQPTTLTTTTKPSTPTTTTTKPSTPTTTTTKPTSPTTTATKPSTPTTTTTKPTSPTTTQPSVTTTTRPPPPTPATTTTTPSKPCHGKEIGCPGHP